MKIYASSHRLLIIEHGKRYTYRGAEILTFALPRIQRWYALQGQSAKGELTVRHLRRLYGD